MPLGDRKTRIRRGECFAPAPAPALDRAREVGYTVRQAGPLMTQDNPAGGGAASTLGTTAETQTTANTESFLPESTILIVDDNSQNVELLSAFLESLPVKILTAGDGVEALEKVAEHNPDLILLDIMMPRMS